METARLFKVLFAALLLGIVWFANIQYRDLFQTDEGRYAEIPREMVASGDWVTPRLDGFKYFEKPALQYWVTAISFKLFGLHNWTARLWATLTGFLGIFLTGFAATRIFDRRTGWLAAMVLSSSIYYVLMAHFNTLDMGLSFFMSLSLFGFLLAQRAEPRSATERNWMLVAWIAAALGLLSKGLEAVVLPGLALVVYSLAKREWSAWRRLHVIKGLAVFLLVASPWFIVVSIRNPDFLHFFFIHEHLDRYLTQIHHRYGPPWYFIPFLLLAILPWLPQFFTACRDLFRLHKTDGFDQVAFLWVWVIVIFVFFSLSDSKLPSYILPIVPPLALLLGRELAIGEGRWLQMNGLVILTLALLALWFAPGLVSQPDSNIPLALYKSFMPWLGAGVAVVLVGVLGSLIAMRWCRFDITVLALASTMLVGLQLMSAGAQAFGPVYSTHYLVKQIKPHLHADLPVYIVNDYEQSLPFYLRREVTVVNYQGELAFGMEQAPDAWIPDIATFEARWRRQPGAIAVMQREVYTKLKAERLPMKIIGQDPVRVAVTMP